MSATATAQSQIRYKDQLKMMRAETVVSWFAAAFDRAIEALKIEPAAVTAEDALAKPQRWFGAYY